MCLTFKPQTMAKDRMENLQQPTETSSGSGAQPDTIIDERSLDKQLAIEERYGIDPDTNNIDSAQVRHPNRNADKRTARRRSAASKSSLNKSGNESLTSNLSGAGPEPVTVISREFLEELFNYNGSLCVSVYLSSERSAQGNERVGPMSLKSALQQAEKLAQENDHALVQRTLAPGYELLRTEEFWTNQKAVGLAFFMGDGYFKYVALPFAPDQETVVNNAFLIAPLTPFFFTSEHYYLLTISKNQSKLFRGDKFGLTFIPVEGMPRGIEDVVHLEEKDDENLFRTGSSGAGGGAVYHGTGSSRPDDKENIAMYLAEVDSTIRKEVLHDSTSPLLLAGVGYLIPIYKKVTHYNHIWDKAMTGNHEHENDATLFETATEVMQEHFEASKNKALADYGNKSATDLTSHVVDDIVRAAYYKRIDTLFVSKGARLWGSFDDLNDTLIVHANEDTDDYDLIDKTILKTVLSGGKVFVLDEEEMPVRRMMVATMRYAQ